MMDHIKTLREYNAWRRGDPTLLMIAPEKIGVAIDATIAEVKRLRSLLSGEDDISQSLIDENERLRELIRECDPIIAAAACAEHILDGFKPKRRPLDRLADRVREAAKCANL